jgi:hypothetical protein
LFRFYTTSLAGLGAGGGGTGFVVGTGCTTGLVEGFGAVRTGNPAGIGVEGSAGKVIFSPKPASASILKSAGSAKSVPSGLARIILVNL